MPGIELQRRLRGVGGMGEEIEDLTRRLRIWDR